MTDRELNEMLNHTHQTGISEGLRKSAQYLMDEAKNVFERFGGKDSTAEQLRHFANELHVMANTAHPGEPVKTAKAGKERGEGMNKTKRIVATITVDVSSWKPEDLNKVTHNRLTALKDWLNRHEKDICNEMAQDDKVSIDVGIARPDPSTESDEAGEG